MNGRGFRERLRYRFDQSMAAGPAALIGWLFLVSLAVIILAAAFIALVGVAPAGDDGMGFLEAFWASLMRTLDPGTMGGDAGWSFRLVMLAVTLTGIFIVSALIGVISNGLADRLEQMRKGRSLVLEQDHTIIFNWSETIFDVISQLVVANESRRRPSIVIMADRDKVGMEDEIATKVHNLRNTRIICRSGDPTDLYDIGITNPQACRSVIVLSPDLSDPDARVIKTILALVTDPKRRALPYRIAAEVRSAANAEVARAVGGSEVQLVLADELISKIIVRSTRQPGLSAVYTELLDFEGCEVYGVAQPALAGRTFGEALHYYDKCSLIGLCDEQGKVKLNPPMETIVGPNDKALLIAADDNLIQASKPVQIGSAAIVSAPVAPASVIERTLLIGWNRRAEPIISELAHFVAPGSVVTVAADTPNIEEELSRLQAAEPNLTIELKRIDTCRREEIIALDPLAYDHVLLLGYSDMLGSQVADTRTLVTLLHLRSMRERVASGADVVSEINDVRNIPLVRLTKVDDFVVSNTLVSLILSQASENEYFEQIFDDLLDEEGSEIMLRPAEAYVALGQDTSFHEVVRVARGRDETAIGHVISGPTSMATDGAKRVIVNPNKTDVLRYDQGDRIIVLALD